MLEHFADQILDLDPCEVEEILPEIQARMVAADNSPEWRRAVISFFIINGVRATQRLAAQSMTPTPPEPCERRRLRLVK
jgi:hypothetical protein